MKNAKNAHFWQVDHRIKTIAKLKKVEILPSSKAWDKYGWSRKYFSKKPEEGYFIWVKEQPGHPLLTCVNISTKNIRQKFDNLMVIEEGLNIELQGFCGDSVGCFRGSHQAVGDVVVKRNSSLIYKHSHSWEKDSEVRLDYKYLLKEGSNMDYVYKTKNTPKILNIKNKITCLGGAKASIKIIANCEDTEFSTKDVIILKGEGASGISRLRLIAGKNSWIKAYSKMLAKSASSGHLDCQSLITGRNAKVSLVPEVVCENKDAQITHEASVGRISEKQLNYLRTRGLNEQQAINLIIAGFLKI